MHAALVGDTGDGCYKIYILHHIFVTKKLLLMGLALAHYVYYNLKGVLHLLPQKFPNLACFVLSLKIINNFLKKKICTL